MTKLRQPLEHGAAVFGVDQMKSEQLADRRLRQRAGDDRLGEAEPVIGFKDFR
jgi:hypothetical protein